MRLKTKPNIISSKLGDYKFGLQTNTNLIGAKVDVLKTHVSKKEDLLTRWCGVLIRSGLKGCKYLKTEIVMCTSQDINLLKLEA